jgi:hypothetical protein
MSLGLLLLIILVVLLIGSAPNWGIHQYGYAPGGVIGVVLIVVLILFLMGKL